MSAQILIYFFLHGERVILQNRKSDGTAHSSNTSDVESTGAASIKETTSSNISRHYR